MRKSLPILGIAFIPPAVIGLVLVGIFTLVAHMENMTGPAIDWPFTIVAVLITALFSAASAVVEMVEQAR